MIFLRRIVGKSMLPALKPRQIILVARTSRIRVGDVVVAFLNGREVVKRVVRMDKGLVYLEGDNKQNSTDSRSQGPIQDSKVEGRVVWPRV